jgi:hypothetical protein
MSCYLHRLGTMVQTKASQRVMNASGTQLQLPADTVGQVRAILQDHHELVVYFAEFDTEIAVAADAVRSSGSDELVVLG